MFLPFVPGKCDISNDDLLIYAGRLYVYYIGTYKQFDKDKLFI